MSNLSDHPCKNKCNRFNGEQCNTCLIQHENAVFKTVTIPAKPNHEGFYSLTVTLPWFCIHCGKPRGPVRDGRSYDGSLNMFVNIWTNQCGHIEKYSEVVAHYYQNQEEIKELVSAHKAFKEVP